MQQCSVQHMAGVLARLTSALLCRTPSAARISSTNPYWFPHSTCASLKSFTSLPVIDVAPLVNPQLGHAAKLRCGQQLHAACKDVGFFVIKNHGMPASVHEGVLREARKWFELPEAAKRSIELRGSATAFRGYQPLGANVTRLPDGGFIRDWHEAIDLFKEEDPAAIQALGLPSSPIHGGNLWPVQSPAFESLLRSYIQGCLTLGSALLRGIALGLGLPEDAFGGDLAAPERSYWVARVIHYPPLAQGSAQPGAGRLHEAAAAAAAGAHVGRDVQLSCGEHTDYGLLTIVNQEPHLTALQVKNAEGEWVDAAPIPGTFVCNIGDMFATLTNGLYTPTLHRVINSDPSRSRVSIPFFFEPSFEARIAPLPQFVKAGVQPAFRAVRYGSHLESKVLSNFEL